ncbi:phosphoribosyltransferase [Calidithermus chliarophilus]|uniref:phosphoribosyltransferase n=1 Tax=Calidithermus chliarophilus TaxID=52023 RepID=UPI0004801327|nr:phosphoribosyltransferase family protein [Calidithermus chliarophilus]
MRAFKDRQEAGRMLAGRLLGLGYGGRADVCVFGLPRGGVPVAYEVARALEAPLEAWVVRKLGTPGQEELAMGAIAAGGGRVLNAEVVAGAGVLPEDVERVEAEQRRELERRERLYRGDRPFPALTGKTVILVDDGLATGATMKAAVAAARAHRPARLVVAVPVAPPETLAEVRALVDDAVCLQTPPFFQAVGLWYEHFPQTSDQEVQDLLARAGQEPAPAAGKGGKP